MENAFIESFNDKPRDECLNLHWFRSLEEARQIINRLCFKSSAKKKRVMLVLS